MAIALYLSGGVSNADPELSLGGDKSTVAAGMNLIGSLTSSEFTVGTIVYRCIYVVAGASINGLKIWVASETPSASTTVGLAWGAPKNTAQAPIASETIVPGYTFFEPESAALAPSGGDFAAGDYRALWVRYTVAATTPILLERFGLSYAETASVPLNTAIPVVSGVPVAGSTLTGTSGSWDYMPTSYAYQWQSSTDGLTAWANVSGATSYILSELQDGLYIRLRVIATNAYGPSVAAYSAATGQITSFVPVNSVAPVISGTTQEGYSLSCTTGTWSGSPTSYLYSWFYSANGTSWTSTGSGVNTLALTSVHVGKYIKCTVSGVNGSGSGTAVDSNTLGLVVVAAPSNSVLPSISGATTLGSTLTTTTGTWSNSPTGYTYQWQVSDDAISGWADISGATSTTFVITASQVDKYIRSAVTATNSAGSSTVTSAALRLVPYVLDFSQSGNSMYYPIFF